MLTCSSLQTSLLALQQSYKLFQFIEAYIPSSAASTSTASLIFSSQSRTSLLWKWALYDAVTLGLILPNLRIPRLEWRGRARVLLVLAMLLLSWILLGDWKIVNLFSVLGLMLPTSLRGGSKPLSLPAWLALP